MEPQFLFIEQRPPDARIFGDEGPDQIMGDGKMFLRLQHHHHAAQRRSEQQVFPLHRQESGRRRFGRKYARRDPPNEIDQLVHLRLDIGDRVESACRSREGEMILDIMPHLARFEGMDQPRLRLSPNPIMFFGVSEGMIIALAIGGRHRSRAERHALCNEQVIHRARVPAGVALDHAYLDDPSVLLPGWATSAIDGSRGRRVKAALHLLCGGRTAAHPHRPEAKLITLRLHE